MQGDPALARLLAVIDHDKITLVYFCAGDDPCKRDWMEQGRTRYRLELLLPGQARNWPLIARAGLRRLADMAGRG